MAQFEERKKIRRYTCCAVSVVTPQIRSIKFFKHQTTNFNCMALLKAEFFIEPPPDTQRKRRRGERGIGVAMDCHLSHASPSPPSPSPPHRTSVAPPAATLSGLAEGRLLPLTAPPSPLPRLNLCDFQRPRPKARMASIWRLKSVVAEFGQLL